MGPLDLQSIPLFAGLSREERARVASVARLLHWDTGHVALREGEFAFDFYAIKRGAAEVWEHGERIAALGAGDFFGELGVTPPDAGRWSRHRTASVVVTAPTDAIAIDGGAVRRLSDEIPKLRDALRGVAEARKLRDAARRATEARGHTEAS
jgi:CRP/FNR family transcriptional regulator, cyclic AMP receptor protein